MTVIYDNDIMLDMSTPTTPSASWLEYFKHIADSLQPDLPPPLGDQPEDLARRDADVLATIVSLAPATNEEAGLVRQYIFFSTGAEYCQYALAHLEPDSVVANKMRTLYLINKRDAKASRTELLSEQARRRQRVAAAARARQAAMQPSIGHGAGLGGTRPGDATMAPVRPVDSERRTKPLPSDRPKPLLRLIRGGKTD